MLNLRFVALLSTGYNVVDGAYLRQKGIPVSNIPAYSTGAVAQLVFAFLTAFANRVALHSEAVHAWAGYETRARLMSILQENFAAFAEGTPIHVVN